MIHLDNTLTLEERKKAVEDFLAESPTLSSYQLHNLGSYLIAGHTAEDYPCLTKKRETTLQNREVYNLPEDILHSKKTEDSTRRSKYKQIDDKDREAMPELQQLKNTIDSFEKSLKTTATKRWTVRRAIIQMRQQQYLIRSLLTRPIVKVPNQLMPPVPVLKEFGETIRIGGDGLPYSTGRVNLFSAYHISLLLVNYVRLKAQVDGNIESDMFWMLKELEDNIDAALQGSKRNDIYKDILICKIDGIVNLEIQDFLFDKYGVNYSVEYISSLYRNKIPSLIAKQAQLKYLNDYYYLIKAKGSYKTCNRCKEVKLMNLQYFSTNPGSKDGFYSICKDCRALGQKCLK